MSDPKRVLLSALAMEGGAGEVVSLLAKGLIERGVQVLLILRSDHGKVSRDGIPTLYLNGEMLPSDGLRIIREFKPDVVHSHWSYGPIISMAKELCIPTIETIHSEVELVDKEGPPADLTCMPSGYLRAKAVLLPKWDDAAIDLIYNGINPDKLKLLPKKTNKKPVIGMMGQIGVAKGLLRAVDIAKRIDTQAEILFAGECFSDPVAVAAMARGAMHAMTFPGYMPAREFFSICDIYLTLSENEGFGLATIEAVKNGIPVVGIKSGVALEDEDIANGIGGIWFTHYHEESFVMSIVSLLYDSPYRRDISENAKRAFANKYLPETMINAYMREYREVISKQ